MEMKIQAVDQKKNAMMATSIEQIYGFMSLVIQP